MAIDANLLFVLFFCGPLTLIIVVVLLYPFKQEWIVEWKHIILYGNELWRKRVIKRLRQKRRMKT